MKDNLKKYYPELLPYERFKLVLDAMSRDDIEEMNRLTDTCREKSYYMKDAAVTDLIFASREAVMLFTILWLECMQRLLTIWGLGQVQNHNFLADSPHTDKLPENVQLTAAASQLKGIYQGMLQFCKEIDVGPDKLLSWYPPVKKDIEYLREILESDIPTDKGTTDAVLSLLRTK